MHTIYLLLATVGLVVPYYFFTTFPSPVPVRPRVFRQRAREALTP